MAITSADGYVEYGIESAFGVQAAPNIALGLDEKIGRWTENNGQRVLKKMFSAEPETHSYGTTKGQAGVDFILSNPWFFYPVLGDVKIDYTEIPYKYIFNRSKRPKTITVEMGQELENGSVVRSAVGAIIDSLTIGGRLDDDVRCSVAIKYGKSVVGSTLDSSPAEDNVNSPYEFTQAELEIPTSNEVQELQSFNLSIQNGNKLRYKSFSEDAASVHGGVSMYGLTIDKSALDGTFLDYVQTRKKDLTAKLLFTNKKTGNNLKSIEVVLTGVGASEHGTGMQPVEPIEESIQMDATSCTVTALNNARDVLQ